MDNITSSTSTTTTTPGGTNTTQNKGVVSLQVIDQNAGKTCFKIKCTTPLSKLMNAWCKKNSASKESVRFLYDGERLQGDATAESLGMENDDIIDAVLQQTGGAPGLIQRLATERRCYFCRGKLNPQTLFMFRIWSTTHDIQPCLTAACLPCAVQNVDKFQEVSGRSLLLSE